MSLEILVELHDLDRELYPSYSGGLPENTGLYETKVNDSSITLGFDLPSVNIPVLPYETFSAEEPSNKSVYGNYAYMSHMIDQRITEVSPEFATYAAPGCLGWSFPQLQKGFVRSDLPEPLKSRVKLHEAIHIRDPTKPELQVRLESGTLYANY